MSVLDVARSLVSVRRTRLRGTIKIKNLSKYDESFWEDSLKIFDIGYFASVRDAGNIREWSSGALN